jgi:hypothetical protein
MNVLLLGSTSPSESAKPLAASMLKELLPRPYESTIEPQGEGILVSEGFAVALDAIDWYSFKTGDIKCSQNQLGERFR